MIRLKILRIRKIESDLGPIEQEKQQIMGALLRGLPATFCDLSEILPTKREQVVGWPPVCSFRKNSMASHPQKGDDDDVDSKMGSGCRYVKVSMDGAPYLRKVDLKTYGSYMELAYALEKMFRFFRIGQCGSQGVPIQDGLSKSQLMDLFHGSEYVLTYEDKDGDWMQVGDVPWESVGFPT